VQFGHLELPVTDPPRSLGDDTRVLGFRLESNQGDRFIWVERGGLELLLRPGEPGGGHSIVFYVEDPAAEAEALRACGAEVTLRGSCYHLQDPDGHEYQVVDPHEDHSEDRSGVGP
jgi:catechol 2,3-dioxygenase-like lactoylglutathione lyase family enzyme